MADDQVLGRSVAVKVMRPQLVEQPGFVARFRSEARAMATIKHPGVVAVYEIAPASPRANLIH